LPKRTKKDKSKKNGRFLLKYGQNAKTNGPGQFKKKDKDGKPQKM
jgi:hypothetical protein